MCFCFYKGYLWKLITHVCQKLHICVGASSRQTHLAIMGEGGQKFDCAFISCQADGTPTSILSDCNHIFSPDQPLRLLSTSSYI